MAGLCAPLSTLRRHPHGGQRMTRGQRGSLLLHCGGLAPPTPCRFCRRTTYVRLFNSHLPAYLTGFSAVAHDQRLLDSSRTAWFGACLCRPTPRCLPSSLVTATEGPFLLTFVSRRTISMIIVANQRPASRDSCAVDSLRFNILSTKIRETDPCPLDKGQAISARLFRPPMVAEQAGTELPK